MFVHIAYVLGAFYSVVFGVLFGMGTIFFYVDQWPYVRLFSIYIIFSLGTRLAISISYLDTQELFEISSIA